MEKYLIFLIIITFIVIYYCFCNQMKETETFTTTPSTGIAIDDIQHIRTLAALARDLQTLTGVTIPGNLTTAGNLRVDGSFNFLPRGIIVAWKGSIAPSGWALCDGSNGITPDLRGRFILGQGQGTGLTNRLLDASGGAETVTLDITNIPPHSHPFIDNSPAGFTYKLGENTNANKTAIESFQLIASNTWNTGGNSTGQTVPHNNMPPFYVLAYIMKL